MTENINETAQAVAITLARSRAARRQIEQAREILRTYKPADDELLHISRAVCHPMLGGSLRHEKKNDVPGQNFGVNSLRLAIQKGDLACIWKKGKPFITPAALREWLSHSDADGQRKSSAAAPVKVASTRTHYERKKGSSSVANAAAKLSALDAFLSKKKKGDK